MSKIAETAYPVHKLIAERWSPYGFQDLPVSDGDLRSLLEAARWAPSSYNEQPWSYLIATRDQPDEFETLLSCLVEGNQGWARAAPVLMLCCTRRRFSRNDKPNAAAVHDLGLAAANLSMEATARGLSVHQMIGILPDRARDVYQLPDDVDAVTGMAIGYAADPTTLSDKFRERDTAVRQRKPISEFVFAGRWGQQAPVVSTER